MPDSCRAVFACICFAGSVLTLPNAASAAPVETNIQGIASVEAPPAGFDALHASQADLARYGLPPRPDALRASAAYDAWTHIVGSAKRFMSPVLKQQGTRHLPFKRVSGIARAITSSASRKTNLVYSSNWSGIADVAGFSSFGASSVYAVYGEWVVPYAQQAFGACTGGTDYSAIWMGIDGYSSNDVFQGGTEADAACSGGFHYADYYIWFEWYPDYSYEITNLPVAPGDDIAGVLVAESSTSGVFYVVNETTNVYTTVTLSAPSGTHLVGNSAEWIVELPSVNNTEGTLTNYVADFMTNTVASERNGTAIVGGYGNSLFPLYALTMVDSNGNPISQPLAVGGSGTSFEDEGSAK